MRKQNFYFKVVCWVFSCAFVLTGCSGNYSVGGRVSTSMDEKKAVVEEKAKETETESGDTSQDENTEDVTESVVTEPEIVDKDWSNYFDGLNGAAVVYDVPNNQYAMYNREHVLARRSPCSTFKIISSLIGLENGIIIPKDSTRTWSGEVFWNEDWNKDIDFSEAFHTSCVWYYRQVIDDIGKVMLVSKQKKTNVSIYGKTGMGMAEGIVVDAWFTGFAKGAEGNMYFCVHLGRTDGMDVSSSLAKEIAIKIVSDYYKQ